MDRREGEEEKTEPNGCAKGGAASTAVVKPTVDEDEMQKPT